MLQRVVSIRNSLPTTGALVSFSRGFQPSSADVYPAISLRHRGGCGQRDGNGNMNTERGVWNRLERRFFSSLNDNGNRGVVARKRLMDVEEACGTFAPTAEEQQHHEEEGCVVDGEAVTDSNAVDVDHHVGPPWDVAEADLDIDIDDITPTSISPSSSSSLTITNTLTSLPLRALLSPSKLHKLLRHHTHPERCPPDEVHVVYERVLEFYLRVLAKRGGGMGSGRRLSGGVRGVAKRKVQELGTTGTGKEKQSENENMSTHVLLQTLFVLRQIDARGYVLSNRAMGRLLVLVGSVYSPFFVVFPSTSTSTATRTHASPRAKIRERARAQAKRVSISSSPDPVSSSEDSSSVSIPSHLHPSLPLRLLLELVREPGYSEGDLAGLVRMVRGLALDPEKGRRVWGVLVEAFRQGREAVGTREREREGEEERRDELIAPYTPPLALLPVFIEASVRAGKVDDAFRMLAAHTQPGAVAAVDVDVESRPNQKGTARARRNATVVDAYLSFLHALRQTRTWDTGTYGRVLEALTTGYLAGGGKGNLQARAVEEVTRQLVGVGDWEGTFVVWRGVSSFQEEEEEMVREREAHKFAQVPAPESEVGLELAVSAPAPVPAEREGEERLKIGAGMYAVLFSVYPKMDRVPAYGPRPYANGDNRGEETTTRSTSRTIPSPRALYRAFCADLGLAPLSSSSSSSSLSASSGVYRNTQMLNVLLRAFVAQGDYPGALVVLRHFTRKPEHHPHHARAKLNHVTYYTIVKALVQRIWYEAGAGRPGRVDAPLSYPERQLRAQENGAGKAESTWTERFLGIVELGASGSNENGEGTGKVNTNTNMNTHRKPRLGMKLVNHILWHVSLEEFCVSDRIYPRLGEKFCAGPDPQGLGLGGEEEGEGEDEDDGGGVTLPGSESKSEPKSKPKSKIRYPMPTMRMMEHVQRPRPFGFRYESVPLERLLERAVWALNVDEHERRKAGEPEMDERWVGDVVRRAEEEMTPPPTTTTMTRRWVGRSYCGDSDAEK